MLKKAHSEPFRNLFVVSSDISNIDKKSCASPTKSIKKQDSIIFEKVKVKKEKRRELKGERKQKLKPARVKKMFKLKNKRQKRDQ